MSDNEIETLAKDILKGLNIPLGKKTELELFENHVQAKLIINKKGIAKVELIGR